MRPTYLQAVVTQATPLRILVDGDDAPLDITPERTCNPVVGDRVLCLLLGQQLIVVGVIGADAVLPPANPWTSPTPENGWANFGGAYTGAGYKLLPDGFVQLRGLVKGGPDNQAIFTLPVGLRPAGIELFNGSASGGVADIRVTAAGVVYVSTYYAGGGNGSVALNGVRFEPA